MINFVGDLGTREWTWVIAFRDEKDFSEFEIHEKY